ncbi:MAG: hypothetical protein HY861_03620 [Chlamydiia bacterium]|nr:hypothetical protein [Chlamydiia bacterium]
MASISLDSITAKIHTEFVQSVLEQTEAALKRFENITEKISAVDLSANSFTEAPQYQHLCAQYKSAEYAVQTNFSNLDECGRTIDQDISESNVEELQRATQLVSESSLDKETAGVSKCVILLRSSIAISEKRPQYLERCNRCGEISRKFFQWLDQSQQEESLPTFTNRLLPSKTTVTRPVPVKRAAPDPNVIQ